jgi:hypothetical protein
MNGQPILGRASAIKHVPADQQVTMNSAGELLDELKIGNLVIVGEKDTIAITIGSEKYMIAYRNRLIKIGE